LGDYQLSEFYLLTLRNTVCSISQAVYAGRNRYLSYSSCWQHLWRWDSVP